ncbi:MAG: ABC transporter ATP-binding protein [Myxococcota bacterium]
MPRRAIYCDGVHKRYGDVHALRGLDLEVAVGECFGLLGPNGAGKTTTIEILEGLMAPDDGVVEVLDTRWGGGRDRQLRGRIGVQLQDGQFTDKLTVFETIRLFRSLYPSGQTVDQVIAAMELDDKRQARMGKLSGGQRQRVALACALISAPELLFLDEPTTGLDPQARLQLWQLIERFQNGGGTVLITTHYMEEAARLCNRVAVVDHGQVIALGSPAELIRSLDADQIVTITTDAPVALAELAALPGVRASRAASARDSVPDPEAGGDSADSDAERASRCVLAVVT